MTMANVHRDRENPEGGPERLTKPAASGSFCATYSGGAAR